MSDAPWLFYSRWVARRDGDGWIVRSGLNGRDAPEPCRFDDYGPALKRADVLNAEEVAAAMLLP